MHEHERIPFSPEVPDRHWKEGMRLPQRAGLDRWFFQWRWPSGDATHTYGGYYATYVIGAQWFDNDHRNAVVVVPKEGCDKIDFLKMFYTCFHNGEDPESFSKIYDIDFSKPMIDTSHLNSVLSPLIVVHFLSVIKEVLRKGLKKDYIEKEDNLKKIRGKIITHLNDRLNIIPRRFDRVYCRYGEWSEDIPENRLLKKALVFSLEILKSATASISLIQLRQTVKSYLLKFSNVDDCISLHEIRTFKRHKLYKEYSTAITLAQQILQRYDYSIAKVRNGNPQKCPVFWLDMSLLYEHYVLGLLRNAYGNIIKYQVKGYTGYPDFICSDPPMVMDAKYIPRFEKCLIDNDICRQLCGYARDRKLFPCAQDKVIPCVVIYPTVGKSDCENPFIGREISTLFGVENQKVRELYTIGVPVPYIKYP
ncbi:MAG: McrC family protein [Muribaculaceae bacterium]|nr:McrC family protein [Muribaculaceae bacterium]